MGGRQWAAAAVAILALSSCGRGAASAHSPAKTPTPSPSSATPSPTATPTPSPTPAEAPARSIDVEFVLHDASGNWTTGKTCSGSGGYSDLAAGDQATLTDERGQILGSATLDDGTADDASHCKFLFSFPSVSGGAAFYSVEVGRRGKITMSAAQLDASGSTFSLSLG